MDAFRKMDWCVIDEKKNDRLNRCTNASSQRHVNKTSEKSLSAMTTFQKTVTFDDEKVVQKRGPKLMQKKSPSEWDQDIGRRRGKGAKNACHEGQQGQRENEGRMKALWFRTA